MSDIKDAIKEKLSEFQLDDAVVPTTSRFGWDNPKYENLEQPVRAVMSSYQNAQRWMDTIKEKLLIDHHLPLFSNIVHELAHTMPERFDEFGKILHTENLEIPYPGTEEWLNTVPDVKSAIYQIYDILDGIKANLFSFKSAAEECGCMSMSIACDSLVTQLSEEYYFFFRAEEMLEDCGSHKCQFDKSVYQYWKEYKNLI